MTQSELRPYVCTEPGCGKSYKRKAHLKQHLRTHPFARAYCCPVENCGKRFPYAGELIRHRRVHTEEKPYQCPVCLREFTKTSSLKEHARLHIHTLPKSLPSWYHVMAQLEELAKKCKNKEAANLRELKPSLTLEEAKMHVGQSIDDLGTAFNILAPLKNSQLITGRL